jgi:hypothetical protein
MQLANSEPFIELSSERLMIAVLLSEKNSSGISMMIGFKLTSPVSQKEEHMLLFCRLLSR